MSEEVGVQMEEKKTVIQAWSKKLRREAERVASARRWVHYYLTNEWVSPHVAKEKISLAELLELKKRRNIGKNLHEEIGIQLREYYAQIQEEEEKK